MTLFLLMIMGACSSKETGGNKVDEPDSNTYSTNSNHENALNRTTDVKEKPALSSRLPKLTSDVSKKMYREYGAVFFAKNGVKIPSKVVYQSESDVSAWQSGVQTERQTIGGVTVELQKPAMESLMRAVSDGSAKGVSITPTGDDAARRNYEDTVALWKSRVDPGLKYWVGRGKLAENEAAVVRALSTSDQIGKIFELEDRRMFFSTDKSKSIIYSVAPPGTSQHISMLALDVKEHDDPVVREVLARQGWFQTVVSDTPHFTYLGVKESELVKTGLKRVSNRGRDYWIPAA